MARKQHYSDQAKQRFWHLLEAYRKALESGDRSAIIYTSLAIHAASADVPRSYRRMIGRVFRETSCGEA